MSLEFKSWQRIDATHPATVMKTKISYGSISGTPTTTSSSYADLTGWSVSFQKLYTVTKVRFELAIPAYVQTSGSTAVAIAIRMNSVDYEVCSRLYNDVSVRDWIGGVRLDAAGVAAGTYTCQARWKRVSGTGTVTLDSSSRIYMHVCEVRE